ncbi:predicted protein [Botrytis cinerea T4]|uniref:Uncharacterized protein n=1 Tax=Botryotinia fuckeliana (strain T4) TaxID=999810 RepID=G2XR22_BOTF4|nr:predicted protein [Botrytis cinerea T4]
MGIWNEGQQRSHWQKASCQREHKKTYADSTQVEPMSPILKLRNRNEQFDYWTNYRKSKIGRDDRDGQEYEFCSGLPLIR